MKKKALIIEDDMITGLDIKNILTDHDYEVTDIVSCGEDAQESSRRNRPDFILVDIGLPGVTDGIATAKTLKEELGVPIIYMTATQDMTTIRKAADLDPYGFIFKPVRMIDLLLTVDTALRRCELERRIIENENRFRIITENMVNLVAMTDSTGIIKYISPSQKTMLGYDDKDIIGRSVFEIIHPEDVPLMLSMREKSQNEKLDVTTSSRIKKADGGYLLVAVSGKTLFGRDGMPEGAVISAYDITESRTAENRLRESEELYRSLVETSPETITIADLNGRVLFINSRGAVMHGYDNPSEICGRSIWEFVSEDDQERAKRDFAGILKTMSIRDYQYSLLKKDGSTFPVELNATLVKDMNGSPKYFIGVLRDITSRKNSEKEIEFFKTMADLSPVGVIIAFAGGEGDILYQNEKILKILGRGKNDITSIEMLIDTLFSRDDATRTRAMNFFSDRPDAGVSSITAQFSIKENGSPDRETLWLKNTIGEKMVYHILDVTERKRAEEALRITEEQFRLFADLLPESFYETDEKGYVTFVNRTGLLKFGYDEDDLNRPVHYLDLVAEDDRVEASGFRDRVLKKGKGQIIEYTGLKKNGETFPIIIHSTPKMVDGRFTGTRGLIVDITERKKIEDDSQRAQKLESIGLLAGGIAHDFSNMLMGILGSISLLKIKLLPSGEIRELIESAEGAAIRAKDLTQQLLTFSRGGMPVKKIISLPELIKKTAEFSLAGSSIKCVFTIEENLWNIDADEGQIGQVISNLIINSKQAMPGGGALEVLATNADVDEKGPGSSFKRVLDGKPGRYVMIGIRDEGEGIKNGNIKKIFDPYFTTKQTGSGLGLSIVYSIVKNHGGFIDLKSETGAGTEFRIYLPAASMDGISETAEKPEIGTRVKGRVLLMDDEDIILKSVSGMLIRYGLEVATVKNGSDAVVMYDTAQKKGSGFDVVVMDLTIPGGMGGKEAVKKILDINRDAKVIITSGYSNDPILSDYKKYGFCGVVTKPYTFEQLYFEIARSINSSC